MASKSKPIVNIPEHETIRRQLGALKERLDMKTKLTKVRTKHTPVPEVAPQQKTAGDSTMKNPFDNALSKLASLEKGAFVPGEELGPQGMDPAMMAGMDPAAMGGMPPGMDPSMMAPADPSMGGMPPGMDPAAMGMPPGMDPAMMGGMPPPAAAPAAAPAAPAPSDDPSARPATMSDISLIEERLKGLEGIMKEMMDVMDSFGAHTSEKAKADASAEAAPSTGAPAMPGPFGSGAGAAMGVVRPYDANKPDNLIRTLNKLKDVNAG